jgi:glycerate dehydrogenase
MKIVFLDSKTLPTPMARPSEASLWQECPATKDSEVVSALAGAEVAITNKVKISRHHLEMLPELKLICVAATGYDCIDIDSCRAHGVLVCNVPAYSSQSVSEHVIASIFQLYRHMSSYVAASQEWSASSHFCVHKAPMKDVAGSVLGIVGKGAIGGATANLAQAVGMKVVYADHKNATETRFGYVAFDEMLAQADVISLHCPLTVHTKELIGANEITNMKSGAFLINTARGGLLNEEAIIAGLKSGKLGGAALDVLQQEPPSIDAALIAFKHPGLFVTPHVAWAGEASVGVLKKTLLDNISAYVNGRPRNVVS